MRFNTVHEAIVYIEGFATRAEDIYDAVGVRYRQQARFPYAREFLMHAGYPWPNLRIAHVTGTSGKGSTSTILAALLQSQGRRVGLYTNPYIVAPQERIQVNGHYIADDIFVNCVDQVAAIVDRLHAKYPDIIPHLKLIWLAVALLAFVAADVDDAVIEVGMGGRFDETNIVTAAVAIITNVGFDHMTYLGPTLEDIAYHKAGIISPNQLVVSGVTQPGIQEYIKDVAQQQSATLFQFDHDFSSNTIALDRSGTQWNYHDHDGDWNGLHIPLIGRHQAINATLAIRAARTLLPQLTASSAQDGLNKVWLPGRFDLLQPPSGIGFPILVMDSAHNPDKMRALVSTLVEVLQWRRIWVLFGAVGSKDSMQMLRELATLSPTIIATLPIVAGRTVTAADDITAQAQQLGLHASSIPDCQSALKFALDEATSEDVIVITGSLFLVSTLYQTVVTLYQSPLLGPLGTKNRTN